MHHSIFLTDLIEKTGLPKDEVAVIRHTLSDEKANRTWRAGLDFFEEYQRIQPEDYFCKKRYIFPGYEKVLWSFSEMARYVNNPVKYPEVYKALAEVNGVYLVLDPVDNKQYIGSAAGSEGIYGRWKTYANTEGKGGNDEHGANKKLASHLNSNPGRYLELQYSILGTIHRTGNLEKDIKAAVELESLYKEKLGSRNKETGLNLN